MTIDWDKPLECEKYGLIKYTGEFCGLYRKVSTISNYKIDEITWWAHFETGESTIGMGDVYNAKRKPKAGEWWMHDSNRVNYFSGAMFLTGPDGVPINANSKPLYPLIKDPSFSEE